MSGRDSPRGSDPDDWFGRSKSASRRGGDGERPPAAEPLQTSVGEPAQPVALDDWLDEQPAARDESPAGESLLGRRGLALAGGAAAVVLIVIGLALGGVFSGSKRQATTSTTTLAPSTSQTPSTPVTQPAPVIPPAPSTTLKPGDQGAQVKRLQRTLTRLGYATGAIDGDYGSSTKSALTRFQRASALTADGVLGPKTLAALKKASRAR